MSKKRTHFLLIVGVCGLTVRSILFLNKTNCFAEEGAALGRMEDFSVPSAQHSAKISGKVKSKVGITSRPYTFWSSDFHIGPIADVKDLFQTWDRTRNYTIIDESLSGHCELKSTCATDLRVLNQANGLTLGNCPNELKRKFWREYARDDRMNGVDAFLCHHSTGMCELFMAFGRPLIISISTRYEIGRTGAHAWHRLNDNLLAIASNPRNTIVANNRYDAEYLMHFTGLSGIKTIPSFCGYTGVLYSPSRHEILIGPGRLSASALSTLVEGSDGIKASAATSEYIRDSKYQQFVTVREKYPRFKYSDLAAHPAIILIPYQVSIMSIFEYYRMGIPLFAPSPELLGKWQVELNVMNELSWNLVQNSRLKKSAIRGHPDSVHKNHDPNDMSSIENVAYWIKYSDFYQWPAITYFEDWKDLFQKLTSANMSEINNEMMTFNKQQMQRIEEDWNDILDRAFDGDLVAPRFSKNPKTLGFEGKEHNQKDINQEISWNDAMEKLYPSVSQHSNEQC